MSFDEIFVVSEYVQAQAGTSQQQQQQQTAVEYKSGKFEYFSLINKFKN